MNSFCKIVLWNSITNKDDDNRNNSVIYECLQCDCMVITRRGGGGVFGGGGGGGGGGGWGVVKNVGKVIT